MEKGKEIIAAYKREPSGLAGYCSRLDGENICRCGSNLKGRYCLWTHIPLPPSFDKRPEWAIDEKGKRC